MANKTRHLQRLWTIPSHFKKIKHIIFVDCDYLTSLWVSQVPRSPKLAIFGVTMTPPPDDDDNDDRQIHTNWLLYHLRMRAG